MRVAKQQGSANPDFMRAYVFSTMTSEEQRTFVQRRFENMDAAELLNILKAIYGHAHDKGHPRCSRARKGMVQCSNLISDAKAHTTRSNVTSLFSV